MEQSKTRMIAEAGVAIAIAQVLSFITLFHMPQVVPLRLRLWCLS